MTEIYTEKWMHNGEIHFILSSSQMDDLDPIQQVWLEEIVNIYCKKLPISNRDVAGVPNVTRPVRLLAKSMETIQHVGRMSRKTIIEGSALSIPTL